MANIYEVEAIYRQNLIDVFMSKLSQAQLEDEELMSTVLPAIHESCQQMAACLFSALRQLEIPVTVDQIVDQASTIEGAVSASGEVVGSVETSAEVTLPVSGKTKTSANADGSYDINTGGAGFVWAQDTYIPGLMILGLVEGDTPVKNGSYHLGTEYILDPSDFSKKLWRIKWNEAYISGNYGPWPTGTFTIDGGEAGVITVQLFDEPDNRGFDFIQVSKAPVITYAAGTVRTPGSIKEATATTTGQIDQGSATFSKLILSGKVKFVGAETTTIEVPQQ